MRYYKPKHFIPQEYLTPAVFKKWGAAGIFVMDPRILWTGDQIREYYGVSVTSNTWHDGGEFSQRGFRDDIDTGAEYSQHRFGRGLDLVIKGVSADEFRVDARSGRLDKVLTYVTSIEEGVPWCHIDCRAIPGTDIKFFSK